MIETALACFRDFHCIADRCPDTCCAGWEVDLDEDVAEVYRTLPGELGDELRSRVTEEDGYVFFRMERGRCPFLNEQGLCRLILSAGDDRLLSETCREHPRFWEEYGDVRETCLSVSCPEAARLLLEGDPELVTWESEALPVDDWEPEPELMERIWKEREEMLARIAEADGMDVLIPQLLERGIAMQKWITEAYNIECDAVLAKQRPDMGGYLTAMRGMEFTDRRLPDLLARTRPGAALPAQEEGLKKLLRYFLYRYLPGAVWDGLLLERLCFCLCSASAIACLAAAEDGNAPLQQAAILYSRETEHSDENLSLLRAAALKAFS